MAKPFVGTAGWSLASQYADEFPGDGTHLERYARRLNAVEINSSFYRPHRRTTYERWAASVADDFRFSAKLPKAITHEARLTEVDDLLARFAAEVAGLGKKLGVVLVQLPPSLAFDAAIAERFFKALRNTISTSIVCEPRHPSWFEPSADELLLAARVARVAADPPPVPGADTPGGWRDIVYIRLHGSPVIYRSAYGEDRLAPVADLLATAAEAWCILDNTASMAATGDALILDGVVAKA